MDAQTTLSSKQGSNSSHVSSEHILNENQPQRPNRKRHRNGGEGVNNSNSGNAEFHANNLGVSDPGSRRQSPPNSARIAERVPEDIDLKNSAHHVIKLFTPVTLCMAVVVATISSVTFYTQDDGIHLDYIPFHEKSDNVETKVWNAGANAGILLGGFAGNFTVKYLIIATVTRY